MPTLKLEIDREATLMRSFLIGLQFLTRITLERQTVWTEEDFGRSVRWFPLVGAVLGSIYALMMFATVELTAGRFPTLEAALALLMSTALTGAIHCDGFMDTFDGLFSGRDRARMLEIMKDSRVGAFGVVSFVMLSMMEFATLIELARLSTEEFLSALYAMPIVGRLMMVLAIGLFPYARASGMGKAFADRTDGRTMIFSTVEAMMLMAPVMIVSAEIFLTAMMAALAALALTVYFGWHATKKLGGLTGDVYGAVALLSELMVLIVFLIVRG